MLTWQILMNKGYVHEMPDSPVAKDWMREFAKLTDDELRTGLRRITSFDGFLNQGAFIKLCKKTDFADFGMPTTEQAYQEACCAQNVLTFNWSHPAVYHAGADTGWFDLRNGVGDAKNRFQQNYWKRFQQVQGNVLPPIPKHELLENRKGKASPETREKYLKQLKELFA